MSGIGCLLLFCAILAYFFLTPLSKSGQTEYLYVDNDDTVDSVFVKLSRIPILILLPKESSSY